MAEHIDRTRLQTDLRYNFDYISKFLNFTKDDIHVLNSLAPILFPRIPYIVETTYKKLRSFDVTKEYFNIHNGEFKRFVLNEATKFTLISAQTDIFKDTLNIYLKRILLQSEWNDTFLKYISEMGELRENQKNCKEINMEYMPMNTLFGYLEHLMIDIIWKLESFDIKKKRAGIRALNKFFWIQNNLFTMYYSMSLKENSISNGMNGKK
ncbi:unnamed protein product [Rotaria sp. Silwood1]|nr:unnamed protein product [Rotaria sp. Silwood1]CAF1046508.1 unnamed protein product [Rotaria sp. Silwood1]CAF1067286.1 unnamed protein product [Rotaria sp. Silwood1]CAF3400012.1 unnamed protein product [Rotaria sp. Silwood1]CAF3431924.1 unnamed protein product [Rotaria sp. Silwood1]